MYLFVSALWISNNFFLSNQQLFTEIFCCTSDVFKLIWGCFSYNLSIIYQPFTELKYLHYTFLLFYHHYYALFTAVSTELTPIIEKGAVQGCWSWSMGLWGREKGEILLQGIFPIARYRSSEQRCRDPEPALGIHHPHLCWRQEHSWRHLGKLKASFVFFTFWSS